jgi:hypothetical protein
MACCCCWWLLLLLQDLHLQELIPATLQDVVHDHTGVGILHCSTGSEESVQRGTSAKAPTL